MRGKDGRGKKKEKEEIYELRFLIYENLFRLPQ